MLRKFRRNEAVQPHVDAFTDSHNRRLAYSPCDVAVGSGVTTNLALEAGALCQTN
jgi:hypothetical protein